ncbi:MAG: glycosyltransferase [Alphaproteobacteria bacterium]|nr:glycosyltransferase [Alphaproteobacteria bacterium]
MPVPTARPRVTIVMTPRERFTLTERAIDAVRASTAVPFRFIFAFADLPDWLAPRLRQRADKGEIELRQVRDAAWPNQIRMAIAADLDTDYVVFLDNDVVPEPGWLEALLACADETGAGIVAPLYLWSDGTGPSGRIHMAGGRLTWIEGPDGSSLREEHAHMNEEAEELGSALSRRPCDFGEYHCLMIRGDLVRSGIVFHERINALHEHIHASLAARERGLATWLEPAARVTYLAFAPYTLRDLAYYSHRWSADGGEESIAAFAERWGVQDDEISFGGVRRFLARHREDVTLLRADAPAGQLARTMRPEDLAQSRARLLDQAAEAGYPPAAIAGLGRACLAAASLLDGAYRACGRPFLNHLVGTASVLLFYRLRIQTVLGGLFHATFTHAPTMTTDPQSQLALVTQALGGPEKTLSRLVHSYATRRHRWKALPAGPKALEDLSLLDAEVLVIAAANEAEMWLSGELRHAPAGREMTRPVETLAKEALATIGLPGLSLLLTQIAATPPAPAPAGTAIGAPAAFMFRSGALVPVPNPLALVTKASLSHPTRSAAR